MDPITWTVSLVSELRYSYSVYLERVSLGRSLFLFPYRARMERCGQTAPYTLVDLAQVTVLLLPQCKSCSNGASPN